MARPKKPEGQARVATLHVRLSDGELAAVAEAAARSGLVLSAWVRDRLLVAAGREVDRGEG